MEKVRSASIVVAGKGIVLSAADVARAVGDSVPEPIRDHYVVVAGRRFPPKQIVALVTHSDRADFTTHQARAILRRLGFATGRANESAPSIHPSSKGRSRGRDVAEATIPYRSQSADALRPHMGRWVALKDETVLVSAESPGEVLAWLRRNSARADTMFRVPLDPGADVGGFAG